MGSEPRTSPEAPGLGRAIATRVRPRLAISRVPVKAGARIGTLARMSAGFGHSLGLAASARPAPVGELDGAIRPPVGYWPWAESLQPEPLPASTPPAGAPARPAGRERAASTPPPATVEGTGDAKVDSLRQLLGLPPLLMKNPEAEAYAEAQARARAAPAGDTAGAGARPATLRRTAHRAGATTAGPGTGPGRLARRLTPETVLADSSAASVVPSAAAPSGPQRSTGGSHPKGSVESLQRSLETSGLLTADDPARAATTAAPPDSGDRRQRPGPQPPTPRGPVAERDAGASHPAPVRGGADPTIARAATSPPPLDRPDARRPPADPDHDLGTVANPAHAVTTASGPSSSPTASPGHSADAATTASVPVAPAPPTPTSSTSAAITASRPLAPTAPTPTSSGSAAITASGPVAPTAPAPASSSDVGVDEVGPATASTGPAPGALPAAAVPLTDLGPVPAPIVTRADRPLTTSATPVDAVRLQRMISATPGSLPLRPAAAVVESAGPDPALTELGSTTTPTPPSPAGGATAPVDRARVSPTSDVTATAVVAPPRRTVVAAAAGTAAAGMYRAGSLAPGELRRRVSLPGAMSRHDRPVTPLAAAIVRARREIAGATADPGPPAVHVAPAMARSTPGGVASTATTSSGATARSDAGGARPSNGATTGRPVTPVVTGGEASLPGLDAPSIDAEPATFRHAAAPRMAPRPDTSSRATPRARHEGGSGAVVAGEPTVRWPAPGSLFAASPLATRATDGPAVIRRSVVAPGPGALRAALRPVGTSGVDDTAVGTAGRDHAAAATVVGPGNGSGVRTATGARGTRSFPAAVADAPSPDSHAQLRRVSEPLLRPAVSPTSREAAAERFLTELSRGERSRPQPLPAVYHPMAEAITGHHRVMISTDDASRRALRAVDKVAATTGDVIHLAVPPAAGGRPVEVLAHELTHVAHASPEPRFFADDDRGPEERKADEIARVIARSPLAPTASLATRSPGGGSAPGTASSSTTSRATRDVIRRAPATTSTGGATGTGTISAADLAEQITRRGSPASNQVIQRRQTVPQPPPMQAPPASGPSTGQVPVPPPPLSHVSAAQLNALLDLPEATDWFRWQLQNNFDRIVRLLEQHIVGELERRGGRTWKGY